MKTIGSFAVHCNFTFSSSVTFGISDTTRMSLGTRVLDLCLNGVIILNANEIQSSNFSWDTRFRTNWFLWENERVRLTVYVFCNCSQ